MGDPWNVTSSACAAAAEQLRRWLFDTALPLWWQVGADHSLGGFHERIDFDGRPVILPRRSRVAARQAFCYCEAGRLGWNGPWRDAAKHALKFLRERFVQSDGTVVSVVGQDGAIVDATFDLYNQAFALLAFACGYGTLDPAGGWQSCAFTLLDTLRRDFAHPIGGFRQDRGGSLRLCANSHMHLLEAALVWISIDSDPRWRHMADEIAVLCLDRFYDQSTGALREFFWLERTPPEGIQDEIIEPGHHYEWAYLLARWAALTGRERPAAVSKLIGFADANGLDRTRQVAVNAINLDGRVHDPVARLWPQTERLRAYLIDRQTGGDARLKIAAESLCRYLHAPLDGLWYENLAADGQFVIEPAPATSLYHIVGAIAEFCAVFGNEVIAPASD